MMMSFRILLVVGIAAVIASPVLAQQAIPANPTNQPPNANPPQNQPTDRATLPHGKSSESAAAKDGHIATCLTDGNQAEITLAKIAIDRAKSSEVKQFAEKMVKDHGHFIQEIGRYAGNRSGGEQAQDGASTSARDGVSVTTQTTGIAVNVGGNRPESGQHMDLLAIQREVGNRCLELTKEELKDKQGAEFDRCYIGEQIGAHVHMLAELEVLSHHVSPELKSVLDKGIETTKTHLDEAKKIAKSLENDHGKDAAKAE